MPNTYVSTPTLNVGTGPTVVYTSPALTASVVLGMTVANILTDPVRCTVVANTARVVSNAVIPPNSSLVVIGKDERVALAAGQTITVSMNVASAADVLVSALQIS